LADLIVLKRTGASMMTNQNTTDYVNRLTGSLSAVPSAVSPAKAQERGVHAAFMSAVPSAVSPAKAQSPAKAEVPAKEDTRSKAAASRRTP